MKIIHLYKNILLSPMQEKGHIEAIESIDCFEVTCTVNINEFRDAACIDNIMDCTGEKFSSKSQDGVVFFTSAATTLDSAFELMIAVQRVAGASMSYPLLGLCPYIKLSQHKKKAMEICEWVNEQLRKEFIGRDE